MWKPEEVIRFASDCVAHGIRAVSLGGGEPFEYDGIFDVIDALYPKCYLSVTSNGLPLEEYEVWKRLLEHSPDKIHLTIHQLDNKEEVQRVIQMVLKLGKTKIKPGVYKCMCHRVEDYEDCPPMTYVTLEWLRDV